MTARCAYLCVALPSVNTAVAGLLTAAGRPAWEMYAVACVAGYSQSAISRLEHNRRAGTDVDVLRSVAAAVGMPPRMFAAIVGAPPAGPVTVATSVAPAEEDAPMRRHTLMTAAGRLDRTGLTRPGDGAAYAQMLCTGAYVAARGGDRDRALELIGDAQRATARLPAHPPAGRMRFPLNRAQVDLYEVGVHWALGDAGRAVEVGSGLRETDFPTAERRGRLRTDLARAWWQRGRPEETARRLLEAARHASAEVQDRPAIRDIAVTLTRQHPRVAGVPELARLLSRR